MPNRAALVIVLAVALTAALVFYLIDLYPGALADRDAQVSLAVKLTVLIFAVAALIAASRTQRLGSVLRGLLAWLGIGLVLVIGYSYWEEIAPVVRRVGGNLLPAEPRTIAPGTVALRADSSRQFRVVAEVNGQRVRFLVDTGASDVALTREDARRIGIDPDRLTYNLPYRTANGISYGAAIRLDRIKVGDITVDDVPGSVAGGELGQSLLGMTFLRRLAGFELRGDELILRR